MSNYVQLSLFKQMREALTDCLITLCTSFSNCEISYSDFLSSLHELMEIYRKEIQINV